MIQLEDQAVIIDSLILCKFVRRAIGEVFSDSAEMLSALTGEPFSGETVRKAARNIQDLKKIFNQRQGWRTAEDTLPERFFATGEPGTTSTPVGIDPEAFFAARECYYLKRGWDAQGCTPPGGALLKALQLA